MSAQVTIPLVLVAGGKGGVGKSTVAANLALSSARKGARTLLVDLDLGLGNIAMLLGHSERGDLGAYLRGEVPLAETVTHGPHGLSVLVAEPGEAQLAANDPELRERLVAGLATLALDYDLVIADGPAGIGPDVLGFARAARRVLVVTTPEPTAMTDAYGFVKATDFEARRQGVDLPTPELFVNQAGDRSEARGVAEHLSGVCRRFLQRSPRFAGWMPRARAVTRAVAERTPFVLGEPSSLAARSIDRLRDHFQGTLSVGAKAIV